MCFNTPPAPPTRYTTCTHTQMHTFINSTVSSKKCEVELKIFRDHNLHIILGTDENFPKFTTVNLAVKVHMTLELRWACLAL